MMSTQISDLQVPGAGGFWVLEAVGQPEGRELASADDVRSLPRPQAAGAEGGPAEE